MRRGTWSRVVRRGVDFIPMKLCGVPSFLNELHFSTTIIVKTVP